MYNILWGETRTHGGTYLFMKNIKVQNKNLQIYSNAYWGGGGVLPADYLSSMQKWPVYRSFLIDWFKHDHLSLSLYSLWIPVCTWNTYSQGRLQLHLCRYFLKEWLLIWCLDTLFKDELPMVQVYIIPIRCICFSLLDFFWSMTWGCSWLSLSQEHSFV